MSRLLLLIACSTSLMGCILRDFDYEPPPNLPPSVHGSTETPLDRVIIVDVDEVPGGDGGAGSSELEFVATVRDANIDEQLTGIVFLDRSNLSLRPESDPFPIPVEQDETPRERRVPFSITRAAITPGCHSVQLHVSHAFNTPVTNPVPAETGDLGVGVWWIAAYRGVMSVEMTACPEPP